MMVKPLAIMRSGELQLEKTSWKKQKLNNECFYNNSGFLLLGPGYYSDIESFIDYFT